LHCESGNNTGLRSAHERGDDADVLLNNDTEADPAMLEHLLLALEQDPAAGAAGPLIYFAAPSRRIWFAGGRCIPALGHASHRGLRRLDDGRYRSVEPTGYLSGCALLARREAWERVGLLDERYHIYAEDADWCLRARAHGYRLLFVPTARLWHKVSASSGAASPWKIYQRLRANLTLFHRHARGLARLTWPPAFLAQQAVLGSWPYRRRTDLRVTGFDIKFPPGPPPPSPNAAIFRGDLARLPIRGEVFDLTVCHYVLEHVTALEACCDELARVTRGGGTLYLS